ncbi:sporulation protein [Ureibacillus thermophilus]|uniref:sporulation protein n=1 Tax=Ureibacillus thermophilus TaxID=367743 RepID=UPI00362005E3
MSFFNKMLASLGIGSAKVDTQLEKSSYSAGETVRGEVEVYGGNVEQRIHTIYFTLYTTYIKEIDDRKVTVPYAFYKFKISDPFTIQANEVKIIPFSFKLPVDTPLTIGSTRVWVKTELDIQSGVDSTDKDYMEVRPSRLASRVLEAVQNLGFRLRKAENEQVSLRYRRNYPFIQEFEFVPISGPFRGRLDELEIAFLAQQEGAVELLLEVDRKGRGLGGLFAEMLDIDESLVRVTITEADYNRVEDKLQQIISRYV